MGAISKFIKAATPGRYGVHRSTPDVVYLATQALPDLVRLVEWFRTSEHKHDCGLITSGPGATQYCNCGLVEILKLIDD